MGRLLFGATDKEEIVMFDFDMDFFLLTCMLNDGALPIGQAVIGVSFVIV